MSVARGCLIRDAVPGVDDDAVAALMVAYLTWAIERLATEQGVYEPPTHQSLVREGLANDIGQQENCCWQSAMDSRWVWVRSGRSGPGLWRSSV